MAQRPRVRIRPELLGDRNELGRADLAAVFVGPPGEGLEPGDFARLQVDQRLIEQLELILIERAAKLGLDRETAPRLGRLLRLVNLRAAGGLGLLDRKLGVAEQLFGILAGIHQRGPDRAFDANFQLGQLERRRHHLLDALGGLQCILDATAKRYEDAELIAACPGEDVAGPQREDQAPGERDQQLVAGKAAHRLVDAREAQHVDNQHGMLEIAGDILARSLDRFREPEAVRQAGEAVAQHLGTQRAFSLDLDRSVNDAEEAARHLRIAAVAARASIGNSVKRRPRPA